VENLWLWLALAGLGALHGLSPANGWMFAAASGMRAGDDAHAWRALRPIAIGHLASIAIAVVVVRYGFRLDGRLARELAGALLIGVATYRALRGAPDNVPDDRLACLVRDGGVGHAGIALWSCLMSTAHGTGWMLIPALAPLCMSGAGTDGAGMSRITAAGSLALGAAAVVVHLGAMLITTGVVATALHRGAALHPRLLRADVQRLAGTAMLAVMGIWLLVPL
jgi:hypothetical protein